MSQPCAVRLEPEDVERRLDSLGLESQLLLEAVVAGEIGRAACTVNDPPAFPGVCFWGYTTRALRERLLALGWTKSDEGNLSVVINASRTIAIVVATGDDATGTAHGLPKTRSPKGEMTLRAIAVNAIQLELFGSSRDLEADEDRGDLGGAEANQPVTWVFLITRTESEVRAELSLPAAVGEKGRIEAWFERILMPPWRPDSGAMIAMRPEAPSIDVPVIRRSG